MSAGAVPSAEHQWTGTPTPAPIAEQSNPTASPHCPGIRSSPENCTRAHLKGGRNDLKIGTTFHSKVPAIEPERLARPGHSLRDARRLWWLLVHVVAIDQL